MSPALEPSRNPLTPVEVKELFKHFDDAIEEIKKIIDVQQFLLFKVQERKRILKEVIGPPSPINTPTNSPTRLSPALHSDTSSTLPPIQASNFLKQMSDRINEYENKTSDHKVVFDQKHGQTQTHTQKKVTVSINTDDAISEKKSDMVYLVKNQMKNDKAPQQQQQAQTQDMQHQYQQPQQSQFPYQSHQHQHAHHVHLFQQPPQQTQQQQQQQKVQQQYYYQQQQQQQQQQKQQPQQSYQPKQPRHYPLFQQQQQQQQDQPQQQMNKLYSLTKFM